MIKTLQFPDPSGQVCVIVLATLATAEADEIV